MSFNNFFDTSSNQVGFKKEVSRCYYLFCDEICVC